MSTLNKSIDQDKLEKFVPRFAKVYQNEETGKWYLSIAKYFSYSYENTSWRCMDCDFLGKESLTPDVNIEEEIIPCASEKEAMFKLAEFYYNIFKEQL